LSSADTCEFTLKADGLAFEAGLTAGTQIIAVNGTAFDASTSGRERLREE